MVWDLCGAALVLAFLSLAVRNPHTRQNDDIRARSL